MSLIADRMRQLDAHITGLSQHEDHGRDHDTALPRIIEVFTRSSASGSPLTAARIRHLIEQSRLAEENGPAGPRDDSQFEAEWLLLGKATVQVYGLVFSTLLDETLPLGRDLRYWNGVISSRTYTSLHALQTLPLRVWEWAYAVHRETWQRLSALYYDRAVINVGSRLSLDDLRRRVMVPFAMSCSIAARKRNRLQRIQWIMGSSIGILLDEGLKLDPEAAAPVAAAAAGKRHVWKGVVEDSITLIEAVLTKNLDLNDNDNDNNLDAKVLVALEASRHSRRASTAAAGQTAEDANAAARTRLVAQRLLGILQHGLPAHQQAVRHEVGASGRPPAPVRYWPAALGLLVSSTTVLRVLFNRRNDIAGWARDLAATARDFWLNWVVEPTRKVVGTIRHDANSEIALLSRDSLRADWDSLERMVVDFARDHPGVAVGSLAVSDAQVAEIRSRVKEGDVTPVLRAYEAGLRRPLAGTLRGDLVRSLLIQVQKTKVDLEVALSGIDALLKSQELVFGFVSLTPGVLVSIGFFQYMRTLLGGRKGLRRSQVTGRVTGVLRRIDRILSNMETATLSYKDRGLLCCEVHELRNLAHRLLPKQEEEEFFKDLAELVGAGAQAQYRALKRIKWGYASG